MRSTPGALSTMIKLPFVQVAFINLVSQAFPNTLADRWEYGLSFTLAVLLVGIRRPRIAASSVLPIKFGARCITMAVTFLRKYSLSLEDRVYSVDDVEVVVS